MLLIQIFKMPQFQSSSHGPHVFLRYGMWAFEKSPVFINIVEMEVKGRHSKSVAVD